MDEIKKNEFKKADDESFDEYMIRIGNACSERKLTWDQAAVVLNEALGSAPIERNISHGRPATIMHLNICVETL